MKNLFSTISALIMMGAFFGSNAWADQSIDVYGRDSYQSYCTNNDYFCPQNVKDRAQQGASRNAQWDCQSRRGQPLTYTSYCSSYCNPAYIPPNTSTWVSCQAECRMTCTLKD